MAIVNVVTIYFSSTRYTCIELKRPHNNILQFRLGKHINLLY